MRIGEQAYVIQNGKAFKVLIIDKKRQKSPPTIKGWLQGVMCNGPFEYLVRFSNKDVRTVQWCDLEQY